MSLIIHPYNGFLRNRMNPSGTKQTACRALGFWCLTGFVVLGMAGCAPEQPGWLQRTTHGDCTSVLGCTMTVRVKDTLFRFSASNVGNQLEESRNNGEQWSARTTIPGSRTYRPVQASALNQRILVQSCDANGHLKVQHFNPKTRRWKQIRYVTGGCASRA